MQTGLFDWQQRFEELDKGGDPLVKLNTLVDWETFRPTLEILRQKQRKSNAGRKPFDVVVMFKILILQSLYNLSDDQTEFQIRDRLSFMRFLGLPLGGRVPDAKTIWLFRDQLTEAGLVRTVFAQFDQFLRAHGFAAQKGQIVDASIVQAPRQRNRRDENQQIKDGQIPEDWSPQKRRQKDVEARWTQKNGRNYYGYKNHIAIDAKHKLIRDYEVTSASVHDSQVFEELLDSKNSSRDVWADSAYRSQKNVAALSEKGYRPHLQRKGCRHRPLTEKEKRGNHRRSKIRSRVEHVFGVQTQRAGTLILRSIGWIRAEAKIGLRNLAYNLDRYAMLKITLRSSIA
jgi:IS5 family transposase